MESKRNEENFPFFTMVKKKTTGIVQNQDNTVTSFYDYDKLISPGGKNSLFH